MARSLQIRPGTDRDGGLPLAVQGIDERVGVNWMSVSASARSTYTGGHAGVAP
jgi:hypothetical protein